MNATRHNQTTLQWFENIMNKLELLPFNLDSPYLSDAVKIYHEYIPGNLLAQEQFFREHLGREGHCGVLARVKDKVVGLAFGSFSLPHQWWHQQVSDHVGSDHAALKSAWVLTQLNVLEAYRNQKIGYALHHRIIQQQPCQNLLLSTQVANLGAQRFYQRLGWHVLHAGFCFSIGDEPFKILHKTLIKNTPRDCD